MSGGSRVSVQRRGVVFGSRTPVSGVEGAGRGAATTTEWSFAKSSLARGGRVAPLALPALKSTARNASFSDMITGPSSLPMLRSLVLFTALAVAVWLGVGG